MVRTIEVCEPAGSFESSIIVGGAVVEIAGKAARKGPRFGDIFAKRYRFHRRVGFGEFAGACVFNGEKAAVDKEIFRAFCR